MTTQLHGSLVRALALACSVSLCADISLAQNAGGSGAPIPTPIGATQAGAQNQPPKNAQEAPKETSKFLRFVRASANGAKVRNIYDAQGVVIGEVPPQGVLAVHAERAGWLEVEAPAPFSVWIFGDLVVPTSEPGVLQVTGSDVRMRPLPSSGPESLPLRQLLGNGQKVRLIGRKDLSKPLAEDWVNVWSPPGTHGWIVATETEAIPTGTDAAALWATAVTEARKSIANTPAPTLDASAEADKSAAARSGDSKQVSDALRNAEALLAAARSSAQSGAAGDYASAKKAYQDVLALGPSESTKKLCEDRIAICTAYADGAQLSSELEAQIATIDAALKRRQEEMARAAKRGPLEGRFDERGWVERVQVAGQTEPIYALRWRGDLVAELTCRSGRFDFADFLDFEIGIKCADIRGPIKGPTAALTRPRAVDVSKLEVVSGRRPTK